MRTKLIAFAAAACSCIMFFCIDNPQDNNTTPLPIKAIGSDSVVAVRDTFTIRVDTAGFATGTARFCFLREDSWTIDTSASLIYKIVWQFPDTGIRRIGVWAYDTAGRRSPSQVDTVEVRIRALAPTGVLLGESRAAVNDAFVLRAVGADRDGTIDRFEWEVGPMGTFVTPASVDSLLVRWSKNDTGVRMVRLWALDNDGLRSAPDSVNVHVAGNFPVCSLAGDTAPSINDTARFTVTGSDVDGKIVGYQWSVGDGLPQGWLTTDSRVFKKVWRITDTGKVMVRVRVVDDDGYVSAPESVLVHVAARSPRVTLKGLFQAVAGDTAHFTARTVDDDGQVVRYDWSIETDTGFSTFSTTDSVVHFVWTEANTGIRLVNVTAIDDDSLRSASAGLSVNINIDRPVLVPLADDTISSLDTLRVKRTLLDTTRRAVMFYWDVNGGAWDDSSALPERVLYFAGATMLRLVCGVRDTAGRFFCDTTFISFNRPPQIEALSLSGVDTVWLGERAIPGALPFNCRVSEPEGETYTTRLVWRSDTLTGSVPATLTIDTVGTYPWSIAVRDSWGNTVTRTGVVVIGRESTVCFAGHSIVGGVGGDGIRGGFRAGVLAGLRDSIGRLERVRAVGPLVTTSEGLMVTAPRDDSCFAISGAIGHEMLLLMDRAYQNLTADIWIVMLGVNGGFSNVEMQSTVSIVSRMFARNPKARVYVLRPSSFSGISLVQWRYYNNNLRDSVAMYATNGFAATMVRSDSILASSDTTKANDSLFADRPALHPNQAGYDRLCREILRVMWSGITRVLPIRKED